MAEALSQTARQLYNIHSGIIKPTEQKPVKVRGHGAVPDLWEK